MLKQPINQLSRPGVFGLSPHAPVSEALKLMQEKNISCVVALEEEKPVGIITERGLVQYLAGHGQILRDSPLREIMTAPVISIQDNACAYEALYTFHKNHIRHLVVVDSRGRASAMLTLTNLVEGVNMDLFMELRPIKKHMDQNIVHVEKDCNLAELLKELAGKKFSCVIYAPEKDPEGILTERELVHLATRGTPLEETRVTEVMHKHLITVGENTPVYQAAWTMREKNIHMAIVLDAEGRPKGMATQYDIIQSLISNYISTFKDVVEGSGRQAPETEPQLAKTCGYLDSILNTSMDMAILATDENWNIVFCNTRAKEIFGMESANILNRKLAELHWTTGMRKQKFESIMNRTAAEAPQSFIYESSAEDEKRYYEARLSPILNQDNALEGFVYTTWEITEKKLAEDNIRYIAYHDTLTGLPNRISFEERLCLEMAHAERYKTKLAVAVMDLNQFKEINDSMGHQAGDLFLKEIGKRLAATLRKSDTVARVGGDEFTLILPKVAGQEDVLRVADKIARVMEPPIKIKNKSWQVHMSAGAAFYPDDHTRAKMLMELADQSMYRAKRESRNREKGFNICLHSEKDPVCTTVSG
ncbi:MAG: diguanylate cyclase domain-containing protein [Thermodesulfobacteriota bacterium]